jgi:aminoglycoside phosphotransferase family enzyme/predicted kinase
MAAGGGSGVIAYDSRQLVRRTSPTMNAPGLPRPASPADDPHAALTRQRLLVSRLTASCFPHPVSRLSVIETHISFVILTGSFAYKIKKHLNLGFLDFSSLEQRRWYCEEELRLNRRLAGPLYLEVIAIGGRVEHPRLDHPSPAIEYAVKMTEFDQHDMFDSLLQRGQLAAADIDALARTVADFHQNLPPADTEETRQYGTPAMIAAQMLANFSELRPMVETPATLAWLDRLEAWTRNELAAKHACLDRRHHDGWVREGHGDLHLGNVVRLASGPCGFDCLEFNPALRWADVMNETAFMVMDLCARGRTDLAFRFLNVSLERTGDYAGLEVFRLYAVYRAMVRAKVAAIRGQQKELAPAERRAAWAQVDGYLAYARAHLAPGPPVIWLMHGFSGSGKTQTSQQLLETAPAVRLRADVERKRLHGLNALADSRSPPGDGMYSTAAHKKTYHHLRDLTRNVVRAGWNVVVDASFLHRWQRELFYELAAELKTPLSIVHCDAPAAVLYERIAARQQAGRDASEAGADILTRQLRTADPLASSEPAVTPDEALATRPALTR